LILISLKKSSRNNGFKMSQFHFESRRHYPAVAAFLCFQVFPAFKRRTEVMVTCWLVTPTVRTLSIRCGQCPDFHQKAALGSIWSCACVNNVGFSSRTSHPAYPSKSIKTNKHLHSTFHLILNQSFASGQMSHTLETLVLFFSGVRSLMQVSIPYLLKLTGSIYPCHCLKYEPRMVGSKYHFGY